ncbi:MAG: hypothetical protein ACI808_001597 [Paraglaciecola sp.]|jgi:uncharacterized protein YifE (UPF0438 family)
MNDTNIRIGTKLFTDVKNFPYGFKKSGDFSIAEATILSVHGYTLQSLGLGTLKPESNEEQHFVEVSKGLVIPKTTAERAWLKYILLTSNRRNFFTLHSSSFNIAVAEEENNEFNNSDLEIEA